MIRTLYISLFLGLALVVEAQNLPSKGEILSDLLKVNQYYMSAFPETKTITTGEPNWLEGSYFNGHLALFDLYPSEEKIKYALQWAEHNNWNIGNRPHEADNQCVGQAYMDLFYAYGAKDEFMLAKVGTSVKNLVNRSAVNEWDWIDALYMAMPVLTRYGIYYNDSKYFDKLYAMYNSTKVSQRLYKSTKGLWFRDGKVLQGRKCACYWSRGNGWVFGAHVRTLMYLPKEDKHRNEYIETFKEMAKTLKSVQRSDGFWNVSLTDPTYFPGPETSGTAFFVYGLAWGINNGILDKDTYMPCVIKGWNGLTSTALTTSGRIGYAQGVADEPKDAQPVTINSSRHYGEGNFLLAGTEVIKLAEGDLPTTEDFYVKGVQMTSKSTLKIGFFEPADKTTAERVTSYMLNKNAIVERAVLAKDGMSCTLTLKNIENGPYGISFENLKSTSGKTIAEGSGRYFYVSDNLVASSLDANRRALQNLSVYPNPINEGSFNLTISPVKNGEMLIQVFNSSGQLLYAKSEQILNSKLHQKINVSNLSKGIYLLKVSGDDIQMNRKLVIN